MEPRVNRLSQCLAAMVAVAAVALAAELPPIPPALTHCSAPAFAGADNDIRIHNDDPQAGTAVTLPKAVEEAMNANTGWLTRGSREEADTEYLDSVRCADVYELVNRIDIAGGLQLYVVHASGRFTTYYYILYLYDPATGKVTKQPPILYGKWASPDFVHRPYVTMADLRGDGTRQIVFEEQVHNGTVYNGIVYNYFDMMPDMELHRVLALEAETHDPDWPQNLFIRTLRRLDARHQRIDLFFTRDGSPRQDFVGYAIVEGDGLGSPFHVVERHAEKKTFSPIVGDNAGILITMSMEEDDAFLCNGYTLYY